MKKPKPNRRERKAARNNPLVDNSPLNYEQAIMVDAINLARWSATRHWSSQQINSAVCGHMLVTWALIVSLSFFLTRTGDAMLNIAAFGFAMFSIACAWMMMDERAPLRHGAIWGTIGSWALILGSVYLAVR